MSEELKSLLLQYGILEKLVTCVMPPQGGIKETHVLKFSKINILIFDIKEIVRYTLSSLMNILQAHTQKFYVTF